jgi:hypothetical protein
VILRRHPGATAQEKCNRGVTFGRDFFRPWRGWGGVGGRFSHGLRRGLSRFSGTRYAGWLDMRSIYARCGADATVNRTGERWRARKAAPMHRDATRATEFDLRKLSATCFSLPVDSDSAGRSLS